MKYVLQMIQEFAFLFSIIFLEFVQNVGLSGSDRERNLAIIDKVKDFQKIDRKVNFITAIALAINDTIIVETEILSGFIADSPRGDNGFGFDEIFELDNGKTLAELNFDEKLEISTRKKALEKIKKYME